MSPTNAERIRALETRQDAVDGRLKSIDTKLAQVIDLFSQIAGGKKVLIGMAAFTAFCIASVVGAFKIWLDWKSKGGH